MSIACACGRVLEVGVELAGRKVRCQGCGRKYRLPSAPNTGSTIEVGRWTDASGVALSPEAAGAVALGETLYLGWVFASFLLTVTVATLGVLGAKYLGFAMAMGTPLVEVADYVKAGMLWGPSVAFLLPGWLVARLSPGRTIVEPALGAAIGVVALLGMVFFEVEPLASFVRLEGQPAMLAGGNLALQANVLVLGMVNAACLACAGAYFGEVAQERTSI